MRLGKSMCFESLHPCKGVLCFFYDCLTRIFLGTLDFFRQHKPYRAKRVLKHAFTCFHHILPLAVSITNTSRTKLQLSRAATASCYFLRTSIMNWEMPDCMQCTVIVRTFKTWMLPADPRQGASRKARRILVLLCIIAYCEFDWTLLNIGNGTALQCTLPINMSQCRVMNLWTFDILWVRLSDFLRSLAAKEGQQPWTWSIKDWHLGTLGAPLRRCYVFHPWCWLCGISVEEFANIDRKDGYVVQG